jgi:toxin-antitoxin system PIN domain toxin
MLVDANLLLYAVHRQSPFHAAAREWLEGQLSGSRRVALAWQSLGSFLRIATHARIFERPLAPADAWGRVTEWLEAGVTWVPEQGERHASILGDLIVRHNVTGTLVPDAQLAALALEHGLTIYSADSDFARFPEVEWRNPVVAA